MQCMYRHFIYYIDKKAIKNDIYELDRKNILNIRNLESLGEGNIMLGIEKFTTGKWWVYFDKSPRHSKYKLHKKLYDLGYFKFAETGCGKCEICKTEKSKDWATKAYCEQKCWKNAIFITLTYAPKNLPMDRKLKRSDIQKFWKDLRYHLYKNTKKATEIDFTLERDRLEEIPTNEIEEMFGVNAKRRNRYPIRYINCGEYGPKTKRPHYHAVIYNFKPMDLRRLYRDKRGYWVYTSPKLAKIWGKGIITVSEATASSAAYVARYCTKKMKRTEEENKKMKEKKQIEFIGASSLGFIGYFWWINHKDEIKRNGGILMITNKHTHLAKVPKAMQKKWKEEDEDSFEEYDYWKCKTGKENWETILAKTDLTESEYIRETYKTRMQTLQKLRRDAI